MNQPLTPYVGGQSGPNGAVPNAERWGYDGYNSYDALSPGSLALWYPQFTVKRKSFRTFTRQQALFNQLDTTINTHWNGVGGGSPYGAYNPQTNSVRTRGQASFSAAHVSNPGATVLNRINTIWKGLLNG
jgi:hypothetical protein